MSGTPRLPPLPASFGNDSPFPPVATPRIPSSGQHQSTPPLPPKRDEALLREQRLRQQEQARHVSGPVLGSSHAGPTAGLRPGQVIPSTATARVPSGAYANMPPSPSPMQMPSPAPMRSFTPTHSQLSGPVQAPYATPMSYPVIQRPATSEPRMQHSNHSGKMATMVSSLQSTHLAPSQRHMSSSDQRRKISSSEDSGRTKNSTSLPPPGTTAAARPADNSSNSFSLPENLSMVLPDLKTLGVMREKAFASGNEKKNLSWCKDVIKYVERKSEGSKITEPALVQYIDESIGVINRSASNTPPSVEALYLRGDLLASGAFPSYHRKNLKAAFNDFELSARMGHAPSWFRIGRDYEILGDFPRAKDAYERGCAVRDVGCIYRMGMANLLSQLGLPMNHDRAIPLLREAADLANVDTPQPSYIYGMLLAGEFSHVEVSPRLLVPVADPAANPTQPVTIESEARRRIQRAAYLNFGPAQYRCGWSYEYAQLECAFDPLLSVQYYSLASQAGEVEADLALSKWFLCGAEACFDKNESLAFTFAEKAARKGLPSAEFAMGYYFEVGVGCEKSIEVAQRWYKKAAGHGNGDAKERLSALDGPSPSTLSRKQHEAHVDTQLVRKRTEAKMKSDRRTSMAAGGLHKVTETSSNGVSKSAQTPQSSGALPPMPSMDLRRRTTMKMVEETARRNRGAKEPERNFTPTYDIPANGDRRGSAPQQPSTRPIPPRLTTPVNNGPGYARLNSPGPGPSPISPNSRSLPASPARGGGPATGAGGNPLYNRPAMPPSSPAGGHRMDSGGVPVKPMSASSGAQSKQVYETFGEMGFATKKTKDDKDCIIC